MVSLTFGFVRAQDSDEISAQFFVFMVSAPQFPYRFIVLFHRQATRRTAFHGNREPAHSEFLRQEQVLRCSVGFPSPDDVRFSYLLIGVCGGGARRRLARWPLAKRFGRFVAQCLKLGQRVIQLVALLFQLLHLAVRQFHPGAHLGFCAFVVINHQPLADVF